MRIIVYYICIQMIMFSLFLNKYHIEFCIPKTMTNNFCMQHVSSYSRYYMTFAIKKEKNRLLATRSFLQSRVEIHCVRFHRFHLEVVNTQNLKKKKKNDYTRWFLSPIKKIFACQIGSLPESFRAKIKND